jgi:hypothetical protein
MYWMEGPDGVPHAARRPAFRDLVRNTDMPSRIASRTLRMLSASARHK